MILPHTYKHTITLWHTHTILTNTHSCLSNHHTGYKTRLYFLSPKCSQNFPDSNEQKYYKVNEIRTKKCLKDTETEN